MASTATTTSPVAPQVVLFKGNRPIFCTNPKEILFMTLAEPIPNLVVAFREASSMHIYGILGLFGNVEPITESQDIRKCMDYISSCPNVTYESGMLGQDDRAPIFKPSADGFFELQNHTPIKGLLVKPFGGKESKGKDPLKVSGGILKPRFVIRGVGQEVAPLTTEQLSLCKTYRSIHYQLEDPTSEHSFYRGFREGISQVATDYALGRC